MIRKKEKEKIEKKKNHFLFNNEIKKIVRGEIRRRKEKQEKRKKESGFLFFSFKYLNSPA